MGLLTEAEKAFLEDFFLSAFPNPERRDCPDFEAIQAFAERGVSLRDPILSHITSCSECYREFHHHKMDAREKSA